VILLASLPGLEDATFSLMLSNALGQIKKILVFIVHPQNLQGGHFLFFILEDRFYIHGRGQYREYRMTRVAMVTAVFAIVSL
jgi:hypothetical protein